MSRQSPEISQAFSSFFEESLDVARDAGHLTLNPEEEPAERPYFALNHRVPLPCTSAAEMEAFAAIGISIARGDAVMDAHGTDFDARQALAERHTEKVRPAFEKSSELICARLACRLWGHENDQVFIQKAGALAFLASSLVMYYGDLDRLSIAMRNATSETIDGMKATARFIRNEALPRFGSKLTVKSLSRDNPSNVGRLELVAALMTLPDEMLILLGMSSELSNTRSILEHRLLDWKRELPAVAGSTFERDMADAYREFDYCHEVAKMIKADPVAVRTEAVIQAFHSDFTHHLGSLRALEKQGNAASWAGLSEFLDALEDHLVYHTCFDWDSIVPDELILNTLTVRLWLGDLLWDLELTGRNRAILLALAEDPWGFKKRSFPAEDAHGVRRLRKLLSYFRASRPSRALPVLIGLLRDPQASDDLILLALGDCCAAQIITGEPGNILAIEFRTSVEEKLLTLLMDMRSLFTSEITPVLYDGDCGREAPPERHIVTPSQSPRPVPTPLPQARQPAPERAARIPSVSIAAQLPFVPIAPAEIGTSAVRLEYVMNPDGRSPRIKELDCTRSDAEGLIAEMLLRHSNITEPASSIARAVFHFAFETPAEHRRLWNKERVGAYSFHKLKRGADRIFIRVKDGRILFHAFARKDWKKSLAA